MSQFLDYLSGARIFTIVSKVVSIIGKEGSLSVRELFLDSQELKRSVFGINTTSLYFTGIANSVNRI